MEGETCARNVSTVSLWIMALGELGKPYYLSKTHFKIKSKHTNYTQYLPCAITCWGQKTKS